MGGCIAPFNAFQLIQGLETLSLRCKAHCENANALAEWLNGHEAVKEGSVLSISLPSHPSHELAKKYFRGFPASREYFYPSRTPSPRPVYPRRAGLLRFRVHV